MSRSSSATESEYRVYKRRWLGLVVLMLLNIVISWGWLTFAPVSDMAQEYFNLDSNTPINWLSTVIFFTFAVASPAVIWIINRYGVKSSILTSSMLVLVGNWIRYAGARSVNFKVVMFGQILIGFAQPFVLNAPTYYSDLWFTSRERVSATALASLSNPFGAALGQLISPFLAPTPEKIPDMVLYISIIATVACVPLIFVPARPPTPPCASSAEDKLPLREAAKVIFRKKEFWVVFIMFSVYLGFFNAMSSLLNQIMLPYGYTSDEAGLTGAILIVVGLVSSAIVSPLIDRSHAFTLAIKTFVPIIAISYVALIFAPNTSANLAGPFVVCGVLGAASFSLLPLALEFIAEITYPASPELASTVMWVGGQLLGGVFMICMDRLRYREGGMPEGNMRRSLIFEAVLAVAVAPLAFCLGLFDKGAVTSKRIELDRVAVQRRSGAV
ncbi:hypothetical protein RUND412_009208 [Rhizina undulata]